MNVRDTRRRRGKVPLRTAAALLFIGLAQRQALGQCEIQKLGASDVGDYWLYGNAVAIEGDLAVVGAVNANGLDIKCGAAYILRFDGADWVEAQKLVASGGEQSDDFGCDVAIYEGEIIIGAYGDADEGGNTGSVYVFRRSGDQWIESQKLVASDPDQYDCFGYSIALARDVMVIGAPGADENGCGSGCAYAFEREGDEWVEAGKVLPHDGDKYDSFGRSVDVSNNTTLIGADGDGDDDGMFGAAYVFTFDGETWTEQQKLTAINAPERARFGNSVAIDGDRAVIGAIGSWDPPHIDTPGAAYVFEYDGEEWKQEHKFTLSTGDDYYAVGVSVAIQGEIVLVGACGSYESPADFNGAVYVLRNVGSAYWEMPLFGDASDIRPWFGEAVAVDGNLALVGASHDDQNAPGGGAAYVFVAGGSDCNDNLIPDECDILDGTSDDVNNNGIPDECENTCVADLNEDGVVDIDDVFALLNYWGPCP